MQKLITIIVPTYNAQTTIEKCINSILNNSYKNIEVIVVNDGSTDTTPNIVNSILQKDNRVRLISQENLGPAGSRNTGLMNAHGDLIAWCDSDDYVDADWLECMYEYLEKYNADIAICRAKPSINRVAFDENQIWIWEGVNIIDAFFEHKLLNGVLWNKLIKRELFDGLKFNLDLWYWEDFRIVWDVLKRAKRVVRFNKEKYNFFIHPNSMCSAKFSNKRAYADIKVWADVINDCKKEFPNHLSHGIKARNHWWIGELALMYKTGYRDIETEKIIQKSFRQIEFKDLKSYSTKQQLFILLLLINRNLAYYITHYLS